MQRRRRMQGAHFRCRKVLKAHPGHFKVLRLAAALAQETGDLDEADGVLSEATTLDPRETNAWFHLGRTRLVP